MTGAALIIIAIVIVASWGMLAAFTEPEVPIIVSAFMVIVILGIVVVLVAVIVDRVKDMQHEHFPKT